MNRHNILSILFMILVAIGTSSCYDDLSTMDVNKIPGVEFDTTGMNAFIVYQFENLQVVPKVNHEGISEENLTYEWRINLQPGDTTYQLIGTDKNLEYEIKFKPNATGYYHQLHYTVIDESTGLHYITTWPVTVKNNIGEGLVVAHTNDEATTDISHIMAPEVTSDYTSESVKLNVYSSINGTNISGIVKQIKFLSIYGKDALLGITDNSIIRINTLDYTFGGINDDLFYGSTPNYQPQLLGAVYQGSMYVGNNRLTATYLGASQKFGLPFDFSYSVPDHVAFNAFGSPPVMINFYDEENQHFVYLPSISSWGDNKMYELSSVSGGAFDPGDVKNKINLVAGVSSTGDFLHLLKDKSTGDIALYVLDGGASDYPYTIPPAPKSYFNLSDAPEINEAQFFVFMDNQKVMYYATQSKIYAVLYSTSTPTYEERYTAPAGESITTLQVYHQADYPFRNEGWDPPYISTNNKQLIMSTYNNLEGKVYLLPIINIGVGNIDQSNVKTFSGFGKITAIATQN